MSEMASIISILAEEGEIERAAGASRPVVHDLHIGKVLNRTKTRLTAPSAVCIVRLSVQ